MRNIFMIIVCIFMLGRVNAQNYPQFRAWNSHNNTYGPATDFPANGVADDFGPRRHNYPFFHGGIDYNSRMNDGDADYGNLILANFAGHVVGQNRLIRYDRQTAYLIMNAGDFNIAYLHLFYDDTTTTRSMNNGTVTAKFMEYPNQDDWAMIFLVNGDTLTLGLRPGIVEFNGDFLEVSDSVEIGDIIGPLGTSGRVGAHLHLSTLPITDIIYSNSRARNPLQFFDYADTTYEYTLYSRKNANQIELEYPGTSFSPLALKNKINGAQENTNRYNHIIDINTVEFRLKNAKMDTFEIIMGDTKEGIISLGGKIGQNIINHPYGNFGSWTLTGVNSFAYNAAMHNPQPWDIWHYSDFVTRIHIDDVMISGSHLYSNCPENSRYNDGEYYFKCKTIDIRDNEEYTDTQIVIIDNFKPYIQSVSIQTIQSSTQFYNESWTCSNNQCISFSNNNLTTSLDAEDCRSGFIVTVIASEEMENLFLSIPAYGISLKEPFSITEGGTSFSFRIDSSEITDLIQEVILHFSGTDKNSNQIIAFTPNHSQQCVIVPTRISDTAWSNPNNPSLNYGNDNIHRFRFLCDIPDDGGLHNGLIAVYEGTIVLIGEDLLVTANISQPTSANNCNNGAIDLTIYGGISPYEVIWYKVNTNGLNQFIKKGISQTGNDGDEDIRELSPGTYLVEIQDALCGMISETFVLDNCECVVVHKKYHKNVSECGGSEPDLWPPLPPYDKCDGILEINIEGTNDYTVNWSNGSTSLYLTNLCTGMYTVTVSVPGCTSFTEHYEICCCWDGTFGYSPFEMCDLPLEIKIINSLITCPSKTSNKDGAISIEVEGGSGATYSWSGPNGFTANTKDISGLGVGTYCVTVNNGCAQTSECYELVESNMSSHTYSSYACTPYPVGSASVWVNGGNKPYKYEWSNGFSESTSSNRSEIKNLPIGEYCVTVTDKYGCQLNDCMIVEGATVYAVPNTSPCGYNIWCGGIPVDFAYEHPVCVFEDPFECRSKTCYCMATGLPTSKEWVDFEGLEFRLEDCTLWGLCPDDPKKVQFIETGFSYYDYVVRYKYNPKTKKWSRSCWWAKICIFELNQFYIEFPLFEVDIFNCPILIALEKQDTIEIDVFLGTNQDVLTLNDSIMQLLKVNPDLKLLINNSFFISKTSSQKTEEMINSQPVELTSYKDELIFIGHESEPGIMVYPNPFNNVANLLITNGFDQKIEFSIYNLLGQKVSSKVIEKYTGDPLILDLHHFKNGLYLIRVAVEGKRSEIKKIMKID